MMTDSRREMSPDTLRKVRRLRELFVESFAERVPRLEAWREQALEPRPPREAVQALRTEIHQLRGSAGLYQMTELYEHLNVLQDQLDDMLEAEPLRPLKAASLQHLDRIIKLLQFPGRFMQP